MKNKNLWLVCAALLLAGVSCGSFVSCGGNAAADNNLVVSIEPLRFIVEGIVGDDFEIGVLVPPGASPETYEPTPLQIKNAENANALFITGLIGFERALSGRLSSPERFIDLSTGIELIEGHDDGDDFVDDDAQGGHHAHSHAQGADPHIWVSPKNLARMAATAYAHIHELYPDSTSYTDNYVRLAERLAALDKEVSEVLAASPTRSFMIFHPGLTYYARDYGLRQIALEHDGKEPSARQLAEIIALARDECVSKVLYQSEFPRRVVEVAAAEIGAEPVEIDILGRDIVGNILKITDIIAGE